MVGTSSPYRIDFEIGDQPYWLKKVPVGWLRSNIPCPECAKYGSYKHIAHNKCLNGKSYKCIGGNLFELQYNFSVSRYTIESIVIRKCRDGMDRVYYVDEKGVNHRSDNSFSSKTEAELARRRIDLL